MRAAGAGGVKLRAGGAGAWSMWGQRGRSGGMVRFCLGVSRSSTHSLPSHTTHPRKLAVPAPPHAPSPTPRPPPPPPPSRSRKPVNHCVLAAGNAAAFWAQRGAQERRSDGGRDGTPGVDDEVVHAGAGAHRGHEALEFLVALSRKAGSKMR